MHELLHAVGFMHEQNREERDTFVKINFNNVEPSREKNFEKIRKGESSNFGVAYDFASVMHYSHVAFSRNGMKKIFHIHKKIYLFYGSCSMKFYEVRSTFLLLMNQVIDFFSQNYKGKPTIEARVQPNGEMGQRNGFSRGDIEKINKMYKC